MKYERNLQIMMAAIQAETDLSAEQLKFIRTALIDGFLRIEQLDAETKRAGDPCRYFPVERVQEGFGFWNSGGFNTKGDIGYSAVAAGLDGEKLRLVRYLSEINGRHALSVVYPGCFIAMATARNTMECENISVYQIIGFAFRGGCYQARGKKVWQDIPRMSRLGEEQESRLARLIGLANRIAITPNMDKLRNLI